MTTQIAETIQEVLDPIGVAVVVEGMHLCSMMRGIKKANASMSTSRMLGNFRDDQKVRAEFLNHIQRG